MPNAHNGYYDTLLEMGYIGFALLLVFITTTLHGIGRMMVRDPARAWVVLSTALFIMIYDGLESTWMRGFEFKWVVFLILAVDIGQYWEPPRPSRRSLKRFSPHSSRWQPAPLEGRPPTARLSR